MLKKIKSAFRILLYCSVLFVIYYLYKFDYLLFGTIQFNYFDLAISIILLCLGFFLSTVSWRKILSVHGIKINQRLATYSHGVSVFAKYIPGKIWVILGRASIVSEKGHSLTLLSTISLKEQLIYLFIGLLISSLVLPFLEISFLIIILVIASMVGLGLLLFSKTVHNKLIDITKRLLKKTLNIPYIDIKKSYTTFIYIISYWSAWSLGFYLLAKSIYPSVPFIATCFFPISVSYGLLAVFLPGGIGVRESIIAFLLTIIGLEPTLAISISVVQRLWFIFGEVFIFLLSLLVKERNK